ncbi:MAG: hypothetical protein COA96_14415 [SAR86 cluster bacterium]|uniref:Cytochrome c domain-containing protein n=1 Tax=SAR86 cluster bacterium TaxID=2030880 RepID=A0A2A5ATN8_9GAMM|nr:MAG: hypothetical protein COA96_14415 [SAR86 cluster bacterium]
MTINQYLTTTFLKMLTATSLMLLVATSAVAQLPELSIPSAASGNSTTAKFFGGATANESVSFIDSFAYDQSIAIYAEIQVEAAHINTMGNLYIIIVKDEQYFMRDENGAFLPWDLNLETLLAASPDKTLQASEPLTIIENIALGPAGVSNTTLGIFIAYNSIAAPGEVFYNGAPLAVTIEAEVVQQVSLSLYTSNISTPIVQAKCVVCHIANGVAANSNLIYLNSLSANFQTINYNTLVDYINNFPGGANLLIENPQGLNAHTGGVQLVSPSTELTQLQEFIDAVIAE